MAPADTTRQRLLDAAGPLFAERGFGATSVRDICTAAAVNQAAINYHFRDKEQFYTEAVRHAATSCTARAPIPQWQPGTPPGQKLRDFIVIFLRRLVVDHEPAWHAQLLMREMTYPTPACAVFVRESVLPCFEALSAVLAELLPGMPEEKRRMCGFSIVGQCLHYRVARPVMVELAQQVGPGGFPTGDVEALADHITEFSLAALERLGGKSNIGHEKAQKDTKKRT